METASVVCISGVWTELSKMMQFSLSSGVTEEENGSSTWHSEIILQERSWVKAL